MSEWTGGHDAAMEIVKFFKAKVTILPQESGAIIMEGRMGRYLLAITTFARDSAYTNNMAIQFRNVKSYTDRGGVIVNDCKGIECKVEENGKKYVIIYGKNGEAAIDTQGVHVTIYG